MRKQELNIKQDIYTTEKNQELPRKRKAAHESTWRPCDLDLAISYMDSAGGVGHWRIQGGLATWAPPCPQDFFNIMQLSGNYEGKTLFLPILGSGPPLKSLLGPPDQYPGSAPGPGPSVRHAPVARAVVVGVGSPTGSMGAGMGPRHNTTTRTEVGRVLLDLNKQYQVALIEVNFELSIQFKTIDFHVADWFFVWRY